MKLQSDLTKILITPSQDDYQNRIDSLCAKKTPAGRFSGLDNETEKVREIIRDVSERGDAAVAEYTKEFDKVELTPEQFRVPKEDLEKAHKDIDKKLLDSLRQAIENVRQYQKEIFIGKTIDGKVKYTPIKRVGICVPGASAPLPSTVIMTAVPAQIAGVKDIVVISPPRYKGSIHPTTLAVCHELGITKVYRIGGVQAVAALASPKGTIPQVDKIVGPGSKWVQSAKKMVSGDYVAIDSIAGPSEVLIIANDSANPAWIASDMLSQAEHADDSIAVVFTDSQNLAENILQELNKQLAELSRTQNAEKSLLEFGTVAVVNGINDIIDLANDIAAEHLHIQCGDKSRDIAGKIENAGAIFIGEYSPVAVGDYWAGPSHTLPTGKTARFSSALSANDFVKATSIIEYSKDQLAQSSEDIIRLAMAEGLDAHAKSVSIRQNGKD